MVPQKIHVGRAALKSAFTAFGLLLAGQAAAQDPIVVDGLEQPMAARYDAQTDRYLVSNSPGGKHGRGFISAISPDGKVIARKWIEGGRGKVELDAPKGLVVHDGKLYVADIDHIRIFDAASGKPIGEVAVKGASNLADLAVLPDGTMLAVDAGHDLASGAVFKIVGMSATELARGPQLWRPTSIAITPDGKVLIGPSIGSTIFEIDAAGKVSGFGQIPAQRMQPSVVRPTERIGGLVALGGDNVLASTWESGRIGKVKLDAKPPLDWDAERRIAAMRKAKAGPASDGLETAAVKRILEQATGRSGPRGAKPRPSIAWPEAKPTDFLWSGLTTPNKMDIDPARNRLLIPELTAGRVVIVPMESSEL